MKRLIITLAGILIASICWSEVLSASMTDIAKLKPLMGTWDFTHVRDFINETSGNTFTSTYTLNNIYKHDGKYYIGGPDALASYNDLEENYHLSDDYGLEFYVFNFTGANTVAGTYWPHVSGNIIVISVPFTGIKVAPAGICAISLIYGTDSEETQLLRSLRDNVLSQSHEGRELIKLYYQSSPVIVQAMEADENFKEEVKELIDAMLPMIQGVVE